MTCTEWTTTCTNAHVVCIYDWNVCFTVPNSVTLNYFWQWMANGSRGLYGPAVLKPVEGGVS